MTQTDTKQKDLWPLGVLVSVITGGWVINVLAGLLLNSSELKPLDHPAFIGLGPFLGGVIGGIVIGLIPWLAQKLPIRRLDWRGWAIIHIALIATGLWLWLRMSADDYLEALMVASPGLIACLLVTAITRWVYNRWLASRDAWWVWVLAVILIIVSILVAFLPLVFLFIMLSQ